MRQELSNGGLGNKALAAHLPSPAFFSCRIILKYRSLQGRVTVVLEILRIVVARTSEKSGKNTRRKVAGEKTRQHASRSHNVEKERENLLVF